MELQHIGEVYNNICIPTFYNKIGSGDVIGVHYEYEGFVNIQTILQSTKETHWDYYICGPGPMIKFGRRNAGTFAGSGSLKIRYRIFNRVFAVSKKIKWNAGYRSILEFAEGNDIEISSGCLFGDCGTCLTEIKEGDVRYMHQTLITADKVNAYLAVVFR